MFDEELNDNTKEEGLNLDVLKSAAFMLVEELKENFKDIGGISLSGSVAQGRADEYSDIDLDIWLYDDKYVGWLENCPLLTFYEKHSIKQECPANYVFIKGDNKFDLTLFSIEQTKKEDWRIEQKGRRTDSIIIFDPHGVVKEILDEKTFHSLGEDYNNKELDAKFSLKFYSFMINAYLGYFVPVSSKRKQYEQANLDLDFALILLLEYIYLKKGLFFPDNKSKWQIVNTLDKDLAEQFSEAKLIREHSVLEIKRRRKILYDLCLRLGLSREKFSHHKIDLED